MVGSGGIAIMKSALGPDLQLLRWNFSLREICGVDQDMVWTQACQYKKVSLDVSWWTLNAQSTLDWLLIDSWLTLDWLLIDSWLTFDWLLIDSWLTLDCLLIDSDLPNLTKPQPMSYWNFSPSPIKIQSNIMISQL